MKRRYCIRVIGIVACVVAISVAPFAIVNAEDILPPTPFYPTQGQQGAPVAPSFEWSEVVNAVSYDFQLGTDPSLSYTIVDTNLESTQYEYTGNGLDWDTNYYWRVRSIAADETISYWSSIQNFHTMLEPNAPVITSHPGGTGYDGLCGICHMLGGTDPMPDDGYHENFDVAECYDCHQTTTPPDPTITVSEPTTITVSVPPAVTLTQTGTSTPTIIMPVESTVTITQTQTITIPPVTLTNTETNLEIVTITLPTLPPQTTTIQQPPVTVTINHTESLIYEPITTTYTLPGNTTTNTATITRETTATQFMTVQTPGNSRPDWLIITLVIGGAILTSGLIVMMMVVRGR